MKNKNAVQHVDIKYWNLISLLSVVLAVKFISADKFAVSKFPTFSTASR
jgi:hypothetical protein